MYGTILFPEVKMEVPVDEYVRSFIFERFGVRVVGGTPIAEVVQDSMDRVEMLFELERGLGIRLTEDEVLGVETVGELEESFRRRSGRG